MHSLKREYRVAFRSRVDAKRQANPTAWTALLPPGRYRTGRHSIPRHAPSGVGPLLMTSEGKGRGASPRIPSFFLFRLRRRSSSYLFKYANRRSTHASYWKTGSCKQTTHGLSPLLRNNSADVALSMFRIISSGASLGSEVLRSRRCVFFCFFLIPRSSPRSSVSHFRLLGMR